MAGELKIRSGTKLRMALDVSIGEEPKFNLVCTFVKALDVASFLISIPMVDGQPMALDEGRRLLIRYGSDKDGMIVAGYADDVVKDGIRRCWKIRRVAEQRQFFQRADERLKVTVPITYSHPTWRPDSDGHIRPEEGLTLDISAGGLAAYVGMRLNVGEVCEVNLPAIGTSRDGRAIRGAVAVVCWTREAPRGSPFRFVCGYQFRFADPEERERMQAYTANLKKRYKL